MSARVIRVVRGAGSRVDTPKPVPQVRIASGVSHLSSASREILRGLERGMLRAGYHTIYIHGGASMRVEPKKTDGVLQIWNYSDHTAMNITHYDRIDVAYISGYGDGVHLNEDQREAHRWPNEPPSGVEYVRDVRSNILAAINASNILVRCNIFASRNKAQSQVLEYIIREWAGTIGVAGISGAIREKPEILTLMDIDTIAALHDRLFKATKGRNHKLRNKAREIVDKAYAAYNKAIMEHGEYLMALEGLADPTSEQIRERAEDMIKRAEANPLISGMSVYDDRVRVITPQIMGAYWDGLRHIIVSMDVEHRKRSGVHGIRAHYIDSQGGMRGILGEGSCFGSVMDTINENIFAGEWDMAAMLVLRALMKKEHISSELRRLKKERDSRPESTPDGPVEEEPDGGASDTSS